MTSPPSASAVSFEARLRRAPQDDGRKACARTSGCKSLRIATARASNCLARTRCGRSYMTPPMPTTPAPGLAANASIDRARVRERLRGRREHLVDDRHLRRMDRHLADKAVAAGFLAFAAKAVAVAEIDIDGVDRRHRGGRGAGKAERRAPADRDRENGPAASRLACAPSSADRSSAPQVRPIRRALAPAKVPARNSGRGLGGDRQNFDMAVGQAAHRLAHGELGVGMDDGRAAFRLRQHDGVRFRRRDGVEIGIGQAGLQAVDAHHQIRPRGAGIAVFEKRRRAVAARAPCRRARSNLQGRRSAHRRRSSSPCRVSWRCRPERRGASASARVSASKLTSAACG